MAKTSFMLKCPKCGAEVKYEHYGHKRQDCDNYEAWAASNPRLCKDCYIASKNAEAEKSSDNNDIPLPVITGVSEKQINYAKSLRNKWVAASGKKLTNAIKIRDFVPTEEDLKKLEGTEYKSYDDYKKSAISHYGLEDALFILATDNASEIIDRLKSR